MERQTDLNDLGIAERLSRSGRGPRNQNANARLTRTELELVRSAAKAEGKSVGEWTRDVLLEAASSTGTEVAMFTELIALRLLLNNVLRPLALGQSMQPEQYQALLSEVRTAKHEAAREVLAQYQPASPREQ